MPQTWSTPSSATKVPPIDTGSGSSTTTTAPDARRRQSSSSKACSRSRVEPKASGASAKALRRISRRICQSSGPSRRTVAMRPGCQRRGPPATRFPPMLVAERVGQFFFDSGSGKERLEYTEYGAGPHWVVLLHSQLMPRRMHQPLARALAGEGLHVVTLDLLGHGRSDRPADPLVFSMSAFADQVVALLDHLGAEQAVVGGTSLGANVSLEVAAEAPERVQGLIVEMPVLDNALEAGILAFVPILFAARFAPFTVNGLRRLTRPVP